MSVLLLSLGSRGDAQPFIALAHRLLHATTPAFTAIHLCLPEEFMSLAPSSWSSPTCSDSPASATIKLHAIAPLSSRATLTAATRHFLSSSPTSKSLFASGDGQSDDPMPRHFAAMGAVAEQCVVPALAALHALVTGEKVSTLVVTSLCHVAARALVDLVPDLRVVVLHLQPVCVSGHFPFMMGGVAAGRLAADVLAQTSAFTQTSVHQGHGIPSPPTLPPPNDETKSSYLKSYNARFALYDQCYPAANACRNSLLPFDTDDSSLTPMSRKDTEAVMLGLHPRIFNFFSLPIVPIFDLARVPDLRDVKCIPPLSDRYVPMGWDAKKACPELLRFLSKGGGTDGERQVVAVSTGSVPVPPGAAVGLARIVLKGIKDSSGGAGRKVVLIGALASGFISTTGTREDADLGAWAKTNVFVVPAQNGMDIPFAWLFTHCVAVLCHGGAGVVAAALAAGAAPVVAPALLDQHFWGRLVESGRCGSCVANGLFGMKEGAVREALERATCEEVQAHVKAYAAARTELAERANDQDGKGEYEGLVEAMLGADNGEGMGGGRLNSE